MKFESLSRCVTYYVPSKFGPDQVEDLNRQARLVAELRQRLIACTSTDAIGSWEGITERIVKVATFVESIDYGEVKRIAEWLLRDGEQQCVSIEIDGKLTLATI